VTGDPMKVATAVAARVDGLEVTVDRQGADLAKAQRDIDALSAGLRMALKAPVRTPPGQRDAAPATQTDEEDEGQPNWLDVQSPSEAVELLQGAVRFADRVLPWLGIDVPACWPWHPPLVIETFALQAQYGWAYEHPSPEKVSDFLGRWSRNYRTRAHEQTSGCIGGKHRHDDREYTVDLGRRDDVARWWALERRGQMPGLEEVREV
jgi:hypothetical protein